MRRVFLAVCSLLLAAPCFAQHAGLRQQWQPRMESDARLQQRVETEIICASTQRGLPLLAERTGVSLFVAPESLDTVGERKFTVIAKGCTLKEMMVQLCEALQECHWDVDASGAEPAYLLHRNAGVEAAEHEREEAVRANAEARRREERATRIEEARRALTMTPEEVAELEKTDLFLARALRYPPMRNAMEAFFSLPEQRIEEFAETGRLAVPYPEFPDRAQQLLLEAAQADLRESVKMIAADPKQQADLPEGFLVEAQDQLRSLPERIKRAIVHVSYSWSSLGLSMSLRGEGLGQVVIAVPPPRPRAKEFYRRLLTATGDTKEAAAATLQAQSDQREQARKSEEERQRPTHTSIAPELRQPTVVHLPDQMPRVDLLKLVVKKTGLSVISDAYWWESIPRPPDPLPETMPLHELLDTLAGWGTFEWRSVGKCVVFSRKDWYDQAQREVPESVVCAYREKLRAQGRFTLDDVVALMLSLPDRDFGRGGWAFPQDLADAGMIGLTYPYAQWCAPLISSLTPEQRAQAERPEGLRLGDLSQKQRDKALKAVAARLRRLGGESAVFRITKAEGVEEGRRYTHYGLWLGTGEDEQNALTAWVHLVEIAPKPAAR